MTVLVTGANGLIGANLVRALLQRGHSVRALVRTGSNLAALAELDVTFAYADIACEPDALRQAVAGCDLVFHAATPFSYERSRAAELWCTATEGTGNLLRAAAAAGVRRVVLTSSSVVFGHCADARTLDESAALASADGESGYVAAKMRQDAMAFEHARALGLELVAVCPTVSVGPHDAKLGPSNAVIVRYLSDPWRLSYPGGCNVVSALDVALGHCLVAERGEAGRRYILGGENLTWTAVHASIAELAGVEAPRMEIGHTLSYLAASFEELRAGASGRSALTERSQAEMVGRYYWYEHRRAAALGYRPRPARRALAEAISWLAASPHVSRELRASLRLHDEVYAARGRDDASGIGLERA